MKPVVVFRSDRYRYRPEDSSTRNPPGGDLARDLVAHLMSLGAHLESGDPIPDEGLDGWAIYLRVKGQLLHYFVHWAPLGDPPTDYWAIQINVRRGLVAWLVGRKPAAEEFEVFAEPLRNALAKLGGVSDVRWLSENEFDELYRTRVRQP